MLFVYLIVKGKALTLGWYISRIPSGYNGILALFLRSITTIQGTLKYSRFLSQKCKILHIFSVPLFRTKKRFDLKYTT